MDATDRLVGLTLGITIVFGLCNLALLPTSTIVVSPQNYLDFVKAGAVMSASFFVGRVIRARFRENTTAVAAAFVRRLAEGLMLFARGALLFATFSAVAGLYMYLASNRAAPFLDGRLAAADRALGFDWMAFLALTNSRPWVAQSLVVAYQSTGFVLAALFPLLAFAHREERLMELIALVAVTSLFTGALMYLCPAAGAYAWYRPTPELFGNFSVDAGMWHYQVLEALRSGESFTYLQREGTGLVTFPSFHTVLGVMTVYVVRGMRLLAPALCVLNVTMIVATLPQGGHYLVDVFAGLAIAFVSILIVRASTRAWMPAAGTRGVAPDMRHADRVT